MIKTKELFDEAVSLPVEIRAQLVDELLRSLHPTQKEIDQLWAVEAEKRVEEIKSGKVKTIPGNKVWGYPLDSRRCNILWFVMANYVPHGYHCQ